MKRSVGLTLIFLGVLLLVLALTVRPAKADTLHHLYMNTNHGWADSKLVGVDDNTCNGIPTHVIYYKIALDGDRDGPYRITDPDGCSSQIETRSYDGTRWYIDAFKLCTGSTAGTNCTTWENVTDVT